MFKSLFNYIGKFFISLIIVILIAGLAVWGFSDVATGFSNKTVAKVGNTKITEQDVEQYAYNKKQEMIRNGFNADAIKEYEGFIRSMVMRELVNNTLIKNEIKALKLEINPEDILKADFLSNPLITKEQMQAIIKSNGGEKAFFDSIESDKKVDLLEAAVTGNKPITDSMMNNIYKSAYETRDIVLVSVLKDAISFDKIPSESELIDFYNKNKNDFLAEETRDISYILIDSKKLGSTESETAEEVAYQLSNEILDMLAEGKSLEDIASETNLKVNEIKDLKKSGKQENESTEITEFKKFSNGEFIKEAFRLESGEISSSVESEDGRYYSVIRVNDIVPERVRALEEVRAKLVTYWKENQRGEVAYKMATSIAKEVSEKGLSSELTAKSGIRTQKISGIERNNTKLSEPLIDEIFKTKTSKATDPYMSETGYDFAVITDIKNPKDVDNEKLFSVKSSVSDQIYQELILSYLKYLTSKYSVNVSANVDAQ